MLFARAHVKEPTATVPEHTLAYNVMANSSGGRSKRDAPHHVNLAYDSGTTKDPAQEKVLGITQDTVVKGQKHFMVAVGGVTPLRVPEADHDKYHAGLPVGDPTNVGKCIGYALDKARWDPCHGSWVVDVHIAHHYQNEAVTTYRQALLPIIGLGGEFNDIPKKVNNWSSSNLNLLQTTDKDMPEEAFLTVNELKHLIDESAVSFLSGPEGFTPEQKRDICDMVGTKYYIKEYAEKGTDLVQKILPAQIQRVQMGYLILHNKETKAKEMAAKLENEFTRFSNLRREASGEIRVDVKAAAFIENFHTPAGNIFLGSPDITMTYLVMKKNQLATVLTDLSTAVQSKIDGLDAKDQANEPKIKTLTDAKGVLEQSLSRVTTEALEAAASIPEKFTDAKVTTEAAMGAPAAMDVAVEVPAAAAAAPAPTRGGRKGKQKKPRRTVLADTKPK